MEVVQRSTEQAGGVRDAFIGLAELICQEEVRTLEYHGRDMRSWHPLDESLFTKPIELHQVILEPKRSHDRLEVTQATFRLLGEEESEITVSRHAPSDLNDDPYAQFLFEEFSESYLTHRHSFCFGILRRRRQEQMYSQRLKHAQAQRNFSVVDKRARQAG